MKRNKKSKIKDKEICRILKQNTNKKINTENVFAQHFFFHLLKEQDEEVDVSTADTNAVEKFTPEENKKAFENALEPETPKDQYDVEGLDPSMVTQDMTVIQQITKQLNNFAKFLNDPQKSDSLHNILATSDRPGSLLRGATRKTSDNITRTAGEIEKLKEVLNSFIILAPKKIRDTEQLAAQS